jgi:hypothetical protein
MAPRFIGVACGKQSRRKAFIRGAQRRGQGIFLRQWILARRKSGAEKWKLLKSGSAGWTGAVVSSRLLIGFQDRRVYEADPSRSDCPDPTQLMLIDEISLLLGKRLVPQVATLAQITEILNTAE